MEFKSLDDLEEKVKETINKAIPDHIELPECLILNDITITVIDVSNFGANKRTYIPSLVRANVSLRRL